MKKNLRIVNEVEISKSKRIIAALMLFSYVSVLNPFVAFANTGKQEITECKEILISAQAGGKIELDGASIEIPSGALKKDTKISITHLRRVEDTGESLYNAIPSSGGYRFLPHGTKFLKDVTITLPYSPELNGKPQALEDLFTYFYDEKNHQWIKLERLEVDQKECVVRSLSNHFTDMINATLTLPESASPVDVNLNSIKNLEAAKPDGHLIKFNSPKASNMGDASFSFELAVPAGRRGMEPQVSVSYSSGGGNGIMGKGFDINYGSSITTDTRFGLPEYGNKEYSGVIETVQFCDKTINVKPVSYILDGILLYEKIDERTDNSASYMLQKENRFSKIVHYFDDNNNYWVVTEKNGTKSIYGDNSDACVGDGKEKFTWNITKAVDVHGNYISYDYIKDSGYVYPHKILYTGYEGQKETPSSYSVQFNYDEKPADADKDSWPRADVRIDARSKKIVACKKLLTSITTRYKENKPIRTYSFKYKEGLAKEKMLTALSVKNNAGESYEYGFEYNPVKDFFADPVPWNTRDQKLQAGVSTNIGANFNATAGAGFGFPVADVRLTGGANGSVSAGESYTEDTLIDIDGDGKPDAIKQTDNGIQVALNTGSGFDTFKPLTIDGNYLNVDLDYEKTRSSAVGWNVYTGVGLAVPVVNPTLGLGYSQVLQKTTSETEASFTDMDRDGLVDIIETGKNYYLKNLGGCEFKKVHLKSNAYIPSLSQKFTNKEKNDYYETYYGQTPFRVWKSPYEGILSIHETVSPVTGTYNSKKSIIAKTFIGNEEDCDKELKMSFTGNSLSSYKNDFTIDKDTNVYFITNNGSDPSQSDIEWNVEINYSKAKVLKRNYKNPVYYILDSYICNAVTYKENISDFSEEIQNQFIERCSEKFIEEKNLPDESLMGLYKINCKDNSDTYNRNIEVTISFDQERAQKANYNENIRRLLIENGNFLPVYFTNEEFEKYVEELKENPNIKDELLKEFSACFLHHVTEGIFELIIDSKKTEDISKFYGTYPLSLELKLQSFKKYESFGIGSTFTKDEVIYKDSKQISFENDLKRNSEKNNGTVFEVEENNYVNIGFLGKENEKQPILLNLTDKKLENCDKYFSESTSYYVYSDDNKNIKINLKYNSDSEKEPESEITIFLKNLSYRANNLTKKEFKKIFDDIDVPYTDIHDAYWNWDIEREVKEEKLNDELFLNIPLSEKAQDDLISFMYDKKEKTKKIKNSNNVETEVHDYYYYSLKETPDFEKAQKILDEYKYEIVMNEKFPFYEEDSQKEYVIKEFWRNEKTEDEINEYIAADDSYKIVTSYEEYQKLNDILIEECKKFNIGKYVNIDCEVIYDKEHLYSIIKGENPLEDSFVQMLKMNKSEDNEISFAIEKISIGKVCWNSKKDYSNKNIASLYEITSYTEKINSVSTEFPEEYQKTLGELANDEINAGNTVHVRVNNDEFLYGGVNNWFYGIWKNIWYYEDENVTELTEKNPFSEEALLKCLYNDDTSKIQSKEHLQKKMKSSDDVKKDEEGNVVKQENVVYYYLPEVKNENENYSSIINLKNKDTNYDVDYENSLLGLVVTETTYENTANGKVPVNSYYMPFIFEDIIHSDRAGGQIFYNVDGLFSNKISDNESSSGLSDFKMPVIRKTFTDGDENTPSVSAGLGPISINFADVFSSDKSLEEKFTSFSVGGASVSKNISNSESMQCFQDITGDGIPDILQAAGTKLNVIKGTLNNNEVTFENTNGFSAETFISNLSKNKTDTTIAGASVSSTGNIKTTPKVNSYGQIKTVEVVTLPSSSGSGSLTYSISDSKQSSGLSDINGDGLPDYYTGSFYLLNNGNGFEHVNNTFAEKLYLSESINKSIALNVSVMLGADLYKAASIFPGPSVNVGASYSFSSSNVTKMMTDINGDGLSDILEINPDSNGSGSTEIKVKFNTGNGYTGSIKIKLPEWKDINILDFINQENDATFDLGILDDVDVFKKAKNKLNLTQITKNPFGFGASNFVNSLEWSSSVTLGLNGGIGGNFDYGINIIIPAPPFYIGTVHITGAGGAGANASTTINGTSVKLMDLDGDGLPDHVLKIPNGSIWWKRNLSGKIGLLNKISLPQGGNIQIDYAEQYGTVNNPNFKYVMSKVTVNDGCGGTVPSIEHREHSVVTKYKYAHGYYDRKKKDFYGFKTVTTTFADGSVQIDTYNNDSYYLKGAIKSSDFMDKNGNILSKSTTDYCNAPFALPVTEISKQFETASGNDKAVSTITSYEYDEYGNCTFIEQNFGDGEKLSCEIGYVNRVFADTYILGLPLNIEVYGSDGSILRHREGDYDVYGQLETLREYFSETGFSEHNITYDEYGNISSVKDINDATLSYEYDGTEHMFVEKISQFGTGTDVYVSTIKTDVPTQTKLFETDCNGNTLNYRYDEWQRLSKVWDSYSNEANPAVTYEYYCPNNTADDSHELWYTITNNKVTFDKNDDSVIQTVLQVDGLGRTARTAKTGFVNGKLGWNASGAVEYDEKGRPVIEGMTEFIEGSLETLLNTMPKMTELKTSHKYDARDRKIKTKLPDEAILTTSFKVKNNRLITETTDPLENIGVQETDSRGNIVRVARKKAAGEQLTEVTYKYNEMGEMLKAFDAKGHPISAEYDLLGRRTALESLDSGRQQFFYDAASNLIRETNSALSERGKQIKYEYDGLNRLVKINYPETKDTVYTYGRTSDKNVGAAGKILKVEDASGTLEYEYGELGEVKTEKRTLATHLHGRYPTVTAEMKYRSDYLGRMQSITYPDGEELTYGYDAGGQVVSVTGNHWGTDFNYVTNILYDQYGQRTRIEYGNGTHTDYTYDPARRWLKNIITQKNTGYTYQNINYEFDKVGNINFYENNCLETGRGNYMTKQEYTYDALYQLTHVHGETTYNPYNSPVPEFISTYNQTFEFDTAGLGNMMKKTSTESVSPRKSIGDNLNYSFDYNYDPNYAHRLINIGNIYYLYDDNGNVICEQDGSFESNGDDTTYRKISEEAENVYSSAYGWGLWREEVGGKSNGRYRRTYSWNERNQLVCSQDSRYTTNYIYGQDGQRTNKYSELGETLYFNKMWTLHTDSGNALYGGQNAKNIYLGDTRIVTKLAGPNETTTHEEWYKQYYYHSDHLGSASLITDYKGDEYQRIEYTPYGETWVEKTQNTGLEYLPYKFTGQEKDEETGNYYIGARYLSPKYSRWLSCDPALGEYMSKTKEGEGGIYNFVNLSLYAYAGNSPVAYVDPDGRVQISVKETYTMQGEAWKNDKLNGDSDKSHIINSYGCAVASSANIADTFGSSLTPKDINSNNKYVKDGDMQFAAFGKDLGLSVTSGDGAFTFSQWSEQCDDKSSLNATLVKVPWESSKKGDHWVGVKGMATIDGDDYIVVSASSINDSNVDDGSHRSAAGWKKNKTEILIPVNEIKGWVNFSKKENE